MNEIVIVVKGRNETAPVFAEVRADAAALGDDSGQAITEHITRKLNVLVSDPTLQQAGGPIGDMLGKNISDHVTETLKIRVKESIDRDAVGEARTELAQAFAGDDSTAHIKIKADVDFDKESFGAKIHEALDGNSSVLGELNKFGSKAGDELGDGAKTGFTSVFSGDIVSTIIKGGLVTLTAGVLAPLIAPALGTALSLGLGGGAIGAGVISALKDPGIQQAIGGIKTGLSDAFGSFGNYFKGPVLAFLNQLPGVIKPLQPMLDQIGADLSPVAENLSQGVIGFLQNVLPSIGRAIDKSGPVIDVLASKLPGIGDAIGKLLDHISDGAPEAANFFGLVLDVIERTIQAVGFLVGAFYNMYSIVRQISAGIVNVIGDAIIGLLESLKGALTKFIPGFNTAIDHAEDKVRDFKDKTVKELDSIPDSKTFTLILRTAGTSAAAAIGNIASIIGHADGSTVGAAATGATSSGLTWVGERGAELLRLPPGTGVHTAGDSSRMASSGGGVNVTVGFDKSGLTGLAAALMETLRAEVRTEGGNVQVVLGVAGA